jgi:hypothetical protein
MATNAYQKIASQYQAPSAGVAGSGCQQAANGSVVGFNPAVTATLVSQPVGRAPVAGGFVAWDGTIP